VNTYDPPTTLDAISHNAAVVIGIGGLSIIAMFVFFIEAARIGPPRPGLPDGAVDDRFVVAA
jgi:hypothetical protein